MNFLNKVRRRVFLFLIVMGPGFITSIVDNDASGVASYTVVGAHTQYKLLFILFISTFILIVIQEMSARMGIVTGRGLTDLIRERYGVGIAFLALVLHFLTCFSTSIAEFAGIAGSVELFGISKYIGVPILSTGLFLLIYFGSYKVMERAFILLTVFYFSYVVSGFMVKPPWREIVEYTFTPSGITDNPYYIYLSIVIIGTTITPWMQYYLQSSIAEKGVREEHLSYSRAEVVIGGFATNFFAFFMIITASATLFKAGIKVHTAEEAALALRPIAGDYCYLLFSAGFLNASLMGAVILPIAFAYAVCEFFGWESGLNRSFQEAPHFYTLLFGLFSFASLIVLIPGIPLIKLMVATQFLNGILLPIVVYLLLKLGSRPELMGRYTHGLITNVIGWLTIILVIISVAGMLMF